MLYDNNHNVYNDLDVVDLQFDDEARCIVVRQVDVDPLRDRADTVVFWYSPLVVVVVVVVVVVCILVHILLD